jgi:hypothetical protein
LKRALFLIILSLTLVASGCAGQQVTTPRTPASTVTAIAVAPVPPGFSSSNPVPANTTVAFTESVNDSGQGNAQYSVKLTLEEVLSGNAAMQKMTQDIPFYIVNIPNDREFLLVRFNYSLMGTSPSGVSRLVDRNPFELYNGGSISPADNEYILGPTPDFYGNIGTGGSVDGWIAYTIPKNASDVLLVYGRTFAGNGGIWFKV